MQKNKRVLLISFNVAGHDSLALGYIKAYALQNPRVAENTDIEILGFSDEEGDVRQALYYITQDTPDLIGFSCYCWSMGKVLELCRCIKEIMPKVPLIAGGPEVGPAAQWYLRHHPALDVVVHDEGEAVFLDLLIHFLEKKGALKDISGISFREQGEVISNSDREPIKDLDDIPSPYLTGVMQPKDGVTYLQSFRGCPFRCNYCYESGRHKQIRFFSYDRVQAEIDLVMEMPHIGSFHFVDSVFNLNPKHLRKMSQMLHDANRYGTGLRTVEVFTEQIDEEAVSLMVRAGVQSVETGPQTAIMETQKKIGRYFDPEKFARGVRLLEKEGIEVWCDLIVGLPGDNFFRCLYSLMFTIDLAPSTIVMSILHVLPGTPFFHESPTFGLAFDRDPPHYVVATDTFPFEEIFEAVLFSSTVAKEYNLALSQDA